VFLTITRRHSDDSRVEETLMNSRRRRIAITAASLVGLACTGCGSSGLQPGEVPAVKAAGNVFYHGKPLAKGSVLVVPEQGHAAAGEVKDGHFTLTTYAQDDGAIPGKHKVAVTATEEEKGTKGEGATKLLLPAKYARAETSNIVVTVPNEGTSELKIEVE